MASSCDTYFSQGGDAYKCARSEFTFRRPPEMDVLVDVGETSNFKSRWVSYFKTILKKWYNVLLAFDLKRKLEQTFF